MHNSHMVIFYAITAISHWGKISKLSGCLKSSIRGRAKKRSKAKELFEARGGQWIPVNW